mgnify:CR=1 FL=1
MRINKPYLKYLNRILIVIFSVIALLLTVNSSEELERQEFHKKNFVNLRISTSYFSCVEEIEETSEEVDLSLSGCIDQGILYESTASGLSIKTVNGKTYTLTAAHFCEVFRSDLSSLGYLSSDMEITDSLGNNYDSEIVYLDRSSDLCLVSSFAPIEDDIQLAKDIPEVGEKIFALSSPLSMSGDGVLLHFEGFFSGCNSDKICFYTIPATSGSSGSIVFNNDGEAIGMIQMVPIGFDSVSIGIGRDSIENFLSSASEALSIDLSI